MTMTSLAEKVLKFIEKESLLEKSENSLLAVSGGIDSMSLLHLLFTNDYKLGVAHINYKLRGIESEKDQELVQTYCRENKIVCHVLELDQKTVQNLKAGNLQKKARDIRYEYFKNLCSKHNYERICTAHHSDDRIETLLINLMRGSNLNGLTALGPKRNYIVRPFIRTLKSDIERFAQLQNVPYRLDKSNESLDYQRNFLRNNILTGIYEHIPRARRAMQSSIDYLTEDKEFRNFHIRSELSDFLSEYNEQIKIGPLTRLREHPHGEYLLFHGIKLYGFNRTQSYNILSNRGTESKIYYSKTHHAVVKSDQLVIKVLRKDGPTNVRINSTGKYQLPKGTLSIANSIEVDYNRNPNIEYASISLDEGSLSVRKWVYGDHFKPYGMNGRSKKLSDYFTDLGFNRMEKEEVSLLVQNDQIIWVIGYRLNHDFRVKSDSNIMKLIYQPETT